MNELEEIGEEKLQQLLNAAQIGWWKADFKQKTYICSDFVQNLFGLKSPELAFWDFYNFIKDDYKEQITNEFASIKVQEFYEQSFPVTTRYGEKWIRSKLFHWNKTPDEQVIAWGFIQCITPPERTENEHSIHQIDQLLYQQHSISRSLQSFIQTENISNVIHKMLEDILLRFHGSRVYIFEYNPEQKTQSCIFEVVEENVSAQKDSLQNLPMDATPWWSQQLTHQKNILLTSLQELPPEAIGEKEILELQGIKSIMAVPMITKNTTKGYLGIDIVDTYRTWRTEDYQWFTSLANIISLCLELRKSENEARLEREYFRDLYEHMPIGYVRTKLIYDEKKNIIDFRFIDINPAFNQLTGKKASDYIGRKASEVSPMMTNTASIECLTEVACKNGYKQLNYHDSTETQFFRAILYAAAEDEIVTLFSDMTETLKAHKALNKSEKTLRNLFSNIPVGIEIYDQNGILVDINDKDLAIFGVSDKKQVIGVNLFDNPNFTEELKQQLLDKQNLDFELKYDFSRVGLYYPVRQKGVKNLLVRVRPLYNADGDFENYLLIVIDNTENLTAHNRIRNFENFFSMIAEFAKVGYFKWNPLTREGFALSQWYKNVGEEEDTPLEEILGIYPHIFPEDAPTVSTEYKDLVTGKATTLKRELRVKTSADTYKWIRSNITVNEYDPEHKNIEIIGVNFDITEQKEIENELTKAKNKAETLDKLKSAFLANMSHEIRTPLNAIVGFSNLLADTQENSERQQYLAIIQENNDLLLQLISDILDLSKIEAGTFDFTNTDIDVNNMCSEIIRSMAMKSTEGVEIRFGDHLPECYIRNDRNRITQIINNFINNALKFTHTGNITLGYNIKGKQIEFYVSDTGIGIPKEKLNQVFDRFVKLNNFVHGTGLGLSICKSLVEQMGGKIGVESEEGKGSRFWFRIPFTKNSDAGTPASPARNNETPDADIREHPLILVAEDTDSNFLLISTILKKEYKILRACNGAEAIEKYKNNAPALILMDIKMPVMNGLEATREIRKIDRKIPVIALTAFAFDTDKHNSIEAGCNEYLTKPVSPHVLRDTLKKYLFT